ncbi:MAG: GIY-YIG nuclease family protein [Spongiibacteraceae bacterium]
MLPLATFEYPDSELLAYPPPPWVKSGEIPHDWFKKNVRNFLYPESMICKEAIPYTVNEGPSASGIYFLLHEGEVIYVGKGMDICNRINQHWDKGWDIQSYWCFGGIPELYIEHVEAFYIYTIEPPLNIKYPILHEFVEPLVNRVKEGTLEYINA